MQTNGQFYADKIMDLVNLSAAALVFGQLLSDKVQLEAAAIGSGIFWIGIVISYLLRKGSKS